MSIEDGMSQNQHSRGVLCLLNTKIGMTRIRRRGFGFPRRSLDREIEATGEL